MAAMSDLEAPRPLGMVGLQLWLEFVGRVSDRGLLLLLCEKADEREVLRRQVIRGEAGGGGWQSLAALEKQLSELRESVMREAAWASVEVSDG